MRLRILKPEDYELGFNQLLTEFCHTHIEISSETYRDRITNPNAVYLGAFEDIVGIPRMIGFGSVYLLYKIHYDRPIGCIEDIIIASEFRHQGIGAQLITKLVELAKQHQCYKIELYCIPELEAFYRHIELVKYGIEMRRYL